MASKFNDFFNNLDSNVNASVIANFEEMCSKTRIVAETVTKKSAERFELSRKKIECLDIKAKLAKLYEAYGVLQYEASEEQQKDEEREAALRKEIKTLRDKLSALTAELAEFKKGSDSTSE